MGSGVVGPRILCVGANLESRTVLEGLIDCAANIVGLVTRPADTHEGVSDYDDLHDLCREHKIPVIDTTNINSAPTIGRIRGLCPDYLFTLGWSQLFGDELLAVPRRFVVGSHPSPLPEGRGRAPLPWTILQGHRRSAVTLFGIDSGVDSGAILLQRWFDVPEQVDAAELYDLVAATLRDAFCELYRAVRSGRMIPELLQDESRATWRAKRTPADGHIDFRRPAVEIERLVRAVSRPYPGAYTYFQATTVHVWRASLSDLPRYVGLPGQILLRQDDRLLVQAGDGPLWLGELTIEGQPANLDAFRLGRKFGVAVEDELVRLQRQVADLQQRLDALESLQPVRRVA